MSSASVAIFLPTVSLPSFTIFCSVLLVTLNKSSACDVAFFTMFSAGAFPALFCIPCIISSRVISPDLNFSNKVALSFVKAASGFAAFLTPSNISSRVISPFFIFFNNSCFVSDNTASSVLLTTF